jgi:hypothetical protein
MVEHRFKEPTWSIGFLRPKLPLAIELGDGTTFTSGGFEYGSVLAN